MRQEYIVTLQ